MEVGLRGGYSKVPPLGFGSGECIIIGFETSLIKTI